MNKNALSILFSLVVLCVVLLGGCVNSEVTTTENETALKENIVELDTQLADTQVMVKELEETLTAFQSDQMNSSNYQSIELNKLKQIVNALPNVENKHGYIESISDNGEVIVKRIDMLSDDTMPNGYRLEDLGKNETFQLNSETLYYTVSEVFPVPVSLEDFKAQIQEYPRLMIFTTVDNKVIVVNQQYLP